MTATRITLAPEYDRCAGKQPPATINSYTLIDAGPFELDDRPNRLHVLVACKCGRRRYSNRTEWFGGRHSGAMCVRCYQRSGRKTLGHARYTPIKAPILPDHKMRGAR